MDVSTMRTWRTVACVSRKSRASQRDTADLITSFCRGIFIQISKAYLMIVLVYVLVPIKRQAERLIKACEDVAAMSQDSAAKTHATCIHTRRQQG